MLATHTYTGSSISLVRDEGSRLFLQEVGLPVESLLFGYVDVVLRCLETNGDVRTLVRVGKGGDYEEFCVDASSGEMVILNLAGSSVWHVNESPEKFLRCLEEFTRRLPYGDRDSELEDREAMAGDLKNALLAIDVTTLDEDPGYWHSILNDVCIGDYSDEE